MCHGFKVGVAVPKVNDKSLGDHVRFTKRTFRPYVSGVDLINSKQFEKDLKYALKEAVETGSSESEESEVSAKDAVEPSADS